MTRKSERAAARLGRVILLRKALELVEERAPAHREEALRLARRYLRIDRTDDRLGPDQGQRVRSVFALAVRSYR